ncbi:GNAT family N-acetyltransferase [Massilia sp. W12]|uniref:GNAT family N-acetyltransferase n=1 Tax=Massilia sp. W12 TaxID=3126507 RepID=UPI0030D4295C
MHARLEKIAPEQITIRRATAADATAMAQVAASPGTYQNTLQLPYANLPLWQGRVGKFDPLLTSLLAEVEGEVVGMAALLQESQLRRRHAASLGMMVAGPWIGRGIGGALLHALLEMADNWLQIVRIELNVYEDNAAAIALYRKFGFELEGMRRADAMRNGAFANSLVMARIKALPRL